MGHYWQWSVDLINTECVPGDGELTPQSREILKKAAQITQI